MLTAMRQKVNDAMAYIREHTQDLDEEQYADFIEQLKFELDAEVELHNWEYQDEE